jgi:hypothetical protein
VNWLLTLLTLWAAFQGTSQEVEKPTELMLARICGESFPLETAPARVTGIVRGQRVRWLEFPVSVFFSSRIIFGEGDERRLRVWAWSDTPISKPVFVRIGLPKGWIADGQLEVELLFNAPGYVYELPLVSVGTGWPAVRQVNRAGVMCR